MSAFEYNSRYAKGKLKTKIKELNNGFKKWLLLKVIKREKWVTRFRIYDHLTLQHIEERASFEREPRIPYLDISLKEINFYDVLDIDSIRKENIINLLKRSQKYSYRNLHDALNQYADFKHTMNYRSMGELWNISYNGQQKKHSDYIDYISVRYIKTEESFVVLQFHIIPSNTFLETLKKIIAAENNSRGTIHYNSYLHIFRNKKFISHQSFGSNSFRRSITNLFYDIEHQTKKNVSRYLKGMFSVTKHQGMPRMEYYEVENFHGFHTDKTLISLFPKNFDGPFKDDNSIIEVYLSELDKENRNIIRVVREVKKKDQASILKSSSKEDIDLHFMLENFAFPCAFKAILSYQINSLNTLKRDIYDFIQYISSKRKYGILSFVATNRKYVKLKIRMIRFLTSMKKFENEFLNEGHLRYYDETYLSRYKATNPIKDRDVLLKGYLSEIDYLITTYHSNIKNIQEVFNSVEELNSYRTNLILQLASFVVALLAFIFAFDKVKNFIVWLIELVS